MHLIAYTSEYVGSDLQSDLKQIVAASQQNNPRTGITGVMFSHSNRFLQFLEGPHTDVQQLMNRIDQDPRHTKLHILFDEAIPERGFAKWNMDHFAIAPGNTLELDSLKLIRDACKANLQTRTDTLVGLFKGFIDSELQ